MLIPMPLLGDIGISRIMKETQTSIYIYVQIVYKLKVSSK